MEQMINSTRTEALAQLLTDAVQRLNDTVISFEENDFKSFGIKTIWVSSHAEIPAILRDIRSS